MELKSFFVQDEQGNTLPGALCYLYKRGTEDLIVDIINATGVMLSNPMTADQQGLVQFGAANGLYDVRVVTGNRDFRIPLQLNDVNDDLSAARDYASQAEGARDAAQLSAGVYATIAAGLAAVAEGKYFSVPSAQENEYLVLYQKSSGNAVEIKRYPSARALSSSMKSFATYALMSADLSAGHAVRAAVTNDPTASRNGWYEKNGVSGVGSWEWVEDQPVLQSLFEPVAENHKTITEFESVSAVDPSLPGIIETDEDNRILMQVDEYGNRTFYQEVHHQGALHSSVQVLGGQPIKYLESVEFELSGYEDVTVDEDLRILLPQASNDQDYLTPEQALDMFVPARPGQLRFAVLGDSRTANAWALNGMLTQPRSYPFWAEFFSKGAARFVGTWNYGVAGQTTAQILPRAATAAATEADAVVILCGTNDAYGASSLANIQSMVSTVVKAGKYAVVISELPRGAAGSPPWGTARILQHWKLHQGLMAMSSQPGVIVVNAMPALLDAGSGIGDFLPGFSYDNLHLNCVAAMHVGKAIAAAVADICTAPAPLLLTNVDVFSDVDNSTGNLVANGMMTGTSGLLEGAATGVVADSWRATSTAGLTATASKVAGADGTTWQQLTVSGTAADNLQLAQLYAPIDASSIKAGDVVEFIAEIDVDAGSTAMYGPDMQLVVNGVRHLLSVGYNRAETATSSMPPVAYRGVYVSPPYKFASVPSSVQLSVGCEARQGVSTNGTFRVARVSLRKIY